MISGFLRRHWMTTSTAIALGILFPWPASAGWGDVLAEVFLTIRDLFEATFIPVGTVALVIAGLTLLIAQNEATLAKARTAILAVIGGGILIYVTPPLIVALYQFGGLTVNPAPAVEFDAQAIGLASWMTTIGGFGGIVVIIIAAIRAIASFGDEGSYAAARFMLLHVIIGILIILASVVLRNTLFAPVIQGTSSVPDPLIVYVSSKALVVIFLATTAMLAIIIYAGIRMVLNFGNEEAFNQAKSLIIRSIVGLVIIGFSYVLVRFVASVLG